MSPVPVTNPYTLKTATVLFQVEDSSEVSDFSSHIHEVTFNPSTSSTSWTAVNSYVISDAAPATWSLNLGLVQDLEPTGLLRFLLANEGKRAKLLTTFKDGTEPCLTDVTLSPASFGGTAGPNIAQSTVTLPVTGRPDFDASHALPISDPAA